MSNVNEEVDFKVDLSKAAQAEETNENKEVVEDAVQEQETNEGVLRDGEPGEESGQEAKVGLQEVVEEDQASVEPTKEDIINQYLTDRFKIKVDDLENVLTKTEKTQELPEEVEKYLQYKKDTKRGLKDFVKANEDVSEYDEAVLLREYYRQSNPELDESDIAYIIDERFTVNENADTDRDIKRKTLEKKQELHKAKQYFEQMRDKYKAPLESSSEALPENVKKAVEFYQQYNDDSAKQQEAVQRQRQTFEKKTSDYFTDKFEGFEFNVGEKSLRYKPKDVNEVVKNQSDLSNFINRFVDENGDLKDAKKYHTALNMAMNPEAYAKFFYEQGKADAVNEVVKDGKNINMSVRANVDSSKPGPKFRVMNDSSNFGGGLKINKRK
jgi:hypothetical protein